jgi:tRNA(adenine34) deaminase
MITDILSIHEMWMSEAIRLAEIAYEKDEIPVGAIVVKDSKIIGRGYNQREKLKDPTAHAEIIAITAAANTIDDWRLNDCILYVTKEPCAMCAGAIINSRIESVIFGCYDAERGYCGSVADLCGDPRLKNDITVRGGIKENICLSLIQNFFKTKRKV